MRPMQTEQPELDPTSIRPLNELERALLAALDDQFVSTSVVRDTARRMMLTTAPVIARTILPRDKALANVSAACEELERRGLAERIEVARTPRWRRAGAGPVDEITEG